MGNLKEDLLKIKAFAFDVDGVFSDGCVYLYPENDIVRSMNIKDGYAVQHAIKMGYHIGIITGGRSATVENRFKNLGVTDIYMNASNKMLDYKSFLKKHNLKNEEVLYMGDDIPDYEIMKKVGFPTCPEDAAQEIKDISKYISHKNGGHGCVRDVIEQVLKLQGKWMNSGAFHW